MQVICGKCSRKIESSNINVAKDTAYCGHCENLTTLSSLLNATVSSNFDIYDEVKGTQFVDHGFDWSVEAKHRSLFALFLIPFTAVWAGGSLSGIYGTQIVEGEFDLQASLFGIPFLIGSIVLISICLMSVFGRTYVANQNGRALIFIGVGSLGWYRRFEWSTIDRVVEKSGGRQNHIVLEGSRRLGLGWGLNSKQQYYLANVLRAKL